VGVSGFQQTDAREGGRGHTTERSQKKGGTRKKTFGANKPPLGAAGATLNQFGQKVRGSGGRREQISDTTLIKKGEDEHF